MEKTKRYRWFADSIVVVHVAWTIVVFGGAMLMLLWHPYALYEIIVVSFTLLISLPFGGLCPLTILEERFRRKVNPSFSNDGSYTAFYVNKLFGTHFSIRTVNTTIGIFYFFVYVTATFIMVKG